MRTTLLLILSFAALYATAQSAEQVAAFDKDYKYELYRPYPVENIDAELTPAPKGYKPFYMSHLARHGSRWHSSSKTYNFTLNALNVTLDSVSAVTPNEPVAPDTADGIIAAIALLAVAGTAIVVARKTR